jgi:hypothetical protein
MPEETKPSGSIWSGIAIAGALNIIAVIVGVLTISLGVGIVILAGFPVVQLAWLLHFYFSFRERGSVETAKGILIGAGISVLLSAGCWGVFSTSTFH